MGKTTLIDLSGRVFGRLTVLRRAGTHFSAGGHGFPTWVCACECGNEHVVSGASLRSGNTVSCGCYGHNAKVKSTAPVQQMFTRYKRQARNRNLEFSLSFDEFSSLILKPCHYCGADPRVLKSVDRKVHSGFRANGVDRVDSSVGYQQDNVVTCCKECNQAKNNLSYSAFIDLISRIYRRHVSKVTEAA